MAITKINLDEGANLEFQLAIDGVRENVSEIRFVIESDNMKVGFNGNYHNGTLSVNIPVLENVISAGEKTCYLEVVADSKYFRPFKDSIDFVAPIRVESAAPKKRGTADVTVQVVNATAITEVKTTDQSHDFDKTCKEKRYVLAESRTHVFAKNEDGKYVGVKNKDTGNFQFIEPVQFINKIDLS